MEKLKTCQYKRLLLKYKKAPKSTKKLAHKLCKTTTVKFKFLVVVFLIYFIGCTPQTKANPDFIYHTADMI
ncbi:hypothetical protein AU378_11030 [Chryseobacterium kwangjuense]|uniref:Uncharacterized protein n=1 Tax=Chryseobacterium kwangjuense TaxID=267125 RepID=A0A135WDH5_9FLAO|nr:hypothetical protein AU378_11030 [Chryseobacterium kwangjuense]